MIADIASALLLLVVANTTPWIVGRLLSNRWLSPMDFGATMPDGERLLGSHKTWRGLAAGTLACTLAAYLVGFGPAVGAGVGVVSLLGDALSSCVKRRLRLRPGESVPGLDQLPEALLPLCVFFTSLQLDLLEGVMVVTAFLLINLAIIKVRNRL
jgi:CDP-2,3-bis-(O-geranylgeranyl)-sn-glycerol synthase